MICIIFPTCVLFTKRMSVLELNSCNKGLGVNTFSGTFKIRQDLNKHWKTVLFTTNVEYDDPQTNDVIELVSPTNSNDNEDMDIDKESSSNSNIENTTVASSSVHLLV